MGDRSVSKLMPDPKVHGGNRSEADVSVIICGGRPADQSRIPLTYSHSIVAGGLDVTS